MRAASAWPGACRPAEEQCYVRVCRDDIMFICEVTGCVPDTVCLQRFVMPLKQTHRRQSFTQASCTWCRKSKHTHLIMNVYENNESRHSVVKHSMRFPPLWWFSQRIKSWSFHSNLLTCHQTSRLPMLLLHVWTVNIGEQGLPHICRWCVIR